MNTLTITRVLDSHFEHVLNGGDPIRDDAPGLTTFGNRCDFKTRNGANLLGINQSLLFSEITVIDTFGGTGSFTFANVSTLWQKLIELKYFEGLSISGSGVSRFDELDDTFTYFGNNGKVPIVNESQQKLTPVTFYNINKFTQLSDASVSSLIAGKYVTTALVAGQVKLVLSDLPQFPEALVNAVGYVDYDNTLAGQAYTSGDLQLQNDTLGVNTVLNQLPFGVTSLWDIETNTFDFSELAVGDTVDIRIDVELTTTNASQTANLVLLFNEGEADEFELPFTSDLQFRTVGVEKITQYNSIYIGSNSVKNNPVKLIFRSNFAATVNVNGWYLRVLRKSVNLIDYNFQLNIQERVIEIESTQSFYDLDFLPTKLLSLTRNGIVQTPTIDFNISGVRITPTALQGDFVAGDVLYAVGAVIDDGTFNGVALDPTADHYKGEWNASTNVPGLENGVGSVGNYYKVVGSGTVNFGSGNITFMAGDEIGFDGDIWYKKVNNNQNTVSTNKRYIIFPINQNVPASTLWYGLPTLQDLYSGDYGTAQFSTVTDADSFAGIVIDTPGHLVGMTGNITKILFKYRSNAVDASQTIDLVVHKSTLAEGSIQISTTVQNPIIAARKVINPAYVADAALHTFSVGEILSSSVTTNTVLRLLFKNNNTDSHIQDGQVLIEITEA